MTTIELDFKRPKSEKRKGCCAILIRRGGKSKLLPTPIKVYPHEWDGKRKHIIPENAAPYRVKEVSKGKEWLENLRNALLDIISRLDERKSGYTLKDILRLLEKWTMGGSFFTLVESRVAHLRDSGQKHTADNYLCALNAFKEFRRQKDVPTVELTANIIKDFQNHLVKKGLKMNTVSVYNRNLRAVYNYAVDEEIVKEDKRPFRKAFTGQEKTRKRAVRGDVVKRLIALPLGDDRLSLAKDLFLFSIYTQGMAFVDLARLTESNIKNGRLVYRRSKTNQSLEMDLFSPALQIIRKYRESAKGNPYLFPILYNVAKGRSVEYGTALRSYNRRLRMISAILGLAKPLSSYTSRHTWASLAKWNGVREEVISEAMGHNSLETTTIYLASLDVEVVSSANKTVITSLMA